MAAEAAIADEAFDSLIATLCPFEQRPHIAVAVSGGADSLALALLTDGWCRRNSGALTALIVDHGLRRGSDTEAQVVAGWLGARGIDAHILTHTAEARPTETRTSNVQASARAARYALLTEWCRSNRVLHLLLAHHREDQAETMLLRLGRGSGVDGLAGMAAITERADVRLLRPLLSVPAAQLQASLRACDQDWIEDPSNRDPAFGRVRIRNLLPGLAAEGLTADRLAATAGRLARARAALDMSTSDLLARAAALHPAGYAILDTAALRAAPEEIGLRALARVLCAAAGSEYPPRLDRLERCYAGLMTGTSGRGRTLAGCRILPSPRRPGAVLICREPSAMAADLSLPPGGTAHWDGRYSVKLSGSARGLSIGSLGRAGWSAILRAAPELKRSPQPAAVRPTLPAIRDAAGVAIVPHLGFRRPDAGTAASATIRYAPNRPLSAATFGKTVVL